MSLIQLEAYLGEIGRRVQKTLARDQVAVEEETRRVDNQNRTNERSQNSVIKIY
jgi:hypothetical protein